jgi:L-amino acid N-acyltransferase YncA
VSRLDDAVGDQRAPRIRDAQLGDAGGVHEIYTPFVESTSISFETALPSVDEIARRIASTRARYPWLVAEADGRLLGYAYGSVFNDRAAYLWSVQTSVYVASDAHRRGVGRGLYDALLARVRSLGYVNAYAGITLPNDASVGLHEAVGFRRVGVFPAAGFKFGAWHDVGWWWLPLVEPRPGTPPEPRRDGTATA